MNERDKLIEQLIKEEGGTREQYLSLLNKIAYHESGHTMDPTTKQIGGGPGRGKFQFEIGKDQGGITAARRTKRYLDSVGMEVPKWLDKAASGEELDASKLSNMQQEILFLGNMKEHPKADFEKVMSGEESVEDFWANYHWAGSAKDRAKRIESFRGSVNDYKKKYGTDIASSNLRPEQDEYTPIDRDVSAALPIHVQDNTRVAPVYRQTPQVLPQQEGPQLTQPQEQFPLFDTRAGNNVYDYIKSSKQQDKNQLTHFEGGGTHQQNPLGGIPQGTGANGKPNTVEEGETAFTFGEDKFVFSDRIDLSGKMKALAYGDNQFADGGSMNNCGGPGQPPCDENYFTKIRASRDGVRINPDGSPSTHLMADNDKDTAFPTLFQNKDGSWEDLSSNHDKAFERAKRDNEVYTFSDRDKLINFARKGNWKTNQFTAAANSNEFAKGGFTDPTDPKKKKVDRPMVIGRTANTWGNMLGNVSQYMLGTKDEDLLESPYKPSKGAEYDKYYYRPGMREDVYADLTSERVMKDYNHSGEFSDIHKGLLANGKDRKHNADKAFPLNQAGYKGMYNIEHGKPNKGQFNFGRYTVDAGVDDKGRYISFNDVYDWNGLKTKNSIPFYDRIYENEWDNYSAAKKAEALEKKRENIRKIKRITSMPTGYKL